MKKLLFVFNPHSGTGEICKCLAQVLDIFTKADYEVVVYPTQAAGDGQQKILAEGQRFDRIVVAGGDGMLHELVNAAMLLPGKVPVGYLPTGTVNDFATTNNIPKNAVEAAKIAVSDHVRTLDVGKFGDEFFSYVAAFGIASNVAYDTDQKAKNTWGVLAYIANALRSLEPQRFSGSCSKMTVITEDTTLEGEYMFGVVSNSLSIAGMQNLVDREVVLDDGLLEGLFIKKPQNVMELEPITRGLLTRNFDVPGMSFIRAPRFEIHSEPTTWTLDGENGGEHENVVISAKKQKLYIALPKLEPADL